MGTEFSIWWGSFSRRNAPTTMDGGSIVVKIFCIRLLQVTKANMTFVKKCVFKDQLPLKQLNNLAKHLNVICYVQDCPKMALGAANLPFNCQIGK